MRLSVVIPSYCRADLLARCLATVTRFAPADTEIVVVDDCSESAIIAETASRFPGVRVLRLSARSGFCLAANIGIQASTGEVVELLNDDTEVTAGWADAALARFVSPNVVAVAPLVLQLDPERSVLGLPPLIDSAGDEYDPGGFARKRLHSLCWEGEAPGAGEAPTEPIRVWGASASSAFYRRTALFAAGLFPTDFGAYFEDVDLSHRLRKQGETWFEPASVVWHRVSASYGRTPNRRVLELQSRNEERVFWRNVGWRHLPRHALVLVGKALRRWREGTLTPWLTGRLRAWAGGANQVASSLTVGVWWSDRTDFHQRRRGSGTGGRETRPRHQIRLSQSAADWNRSSRPTAAASARPQSAERGQVLRPANAIRPPSPLQH